MSETERKGAKVRFPPPLVFLLLIGVGVAVQRWIWPLVLPLPFWPRVVGGVLLSLTGVALALSARVLFKRTGQDPRPWKPSPELLAVGIYRYTRNPMYVGMTCLELGIGIAVGNIWIAALAPVGLGLVHVIAVIPEEAYLTEKFGEPYVRYKKSIRRYV